MFENYLKMSWKVLLRRPFFTIISLIGISFTLMILMVGVAFYENSYAPNGVMKNFDRVLTIFSVKLEDPQHFSSSWSPVGYALFKGYVKEMKTPETVSIASGRPQITKAFTNSKKFELQTRFVDAEFWNIFNFRFITGRAFNSREVSNADPVAIIDEKTSLEYFGSTAVIGKPIVINNEEFKIAGVVENVSSLHTQAFAQVFLPITKSKFNLKSDNIRGSFVCFIMAKNSNSLANIRKEWKQILPKVKLPEQFTQIDCKPETMIESVSNDVFHSQKSNVMFFTVVFLLLFMFLSLPSLNLINLNITRIMERSSEIGIRKSFGASSRQLVIQFIFENLILTSIGGSAALIFSFIILKTIDNLELIQNSRFVINLNVFIYGFIFTLIFGLLSGAFPAWKMSKLNIINALKEGNI